MPTHTNRELPHLSTSVELCAIDYWTTALIHHINIDGECMSICAKEGCDIVGIDEERILLIECFAGFACDLSIGAIFKHPHHCRGCESVAARQGLEILVILDWIRSDDKVEINLVADLAW